MKTCASCKQLVPLEGFAKSKKGLMGRKSTCKLCAKIAYSAWYQKRWEQDPEWRKAKSEMATRWAKSNPEKRQEIAKRRNAKASLTNPEKIRARALVNQRVRFGRMPAAKTLSCAICSLQAHEYHHHNGYSFEHRYDVIPVCRNCHKKIELTGANG